MVQNANLTLNETLGDLSLLNGTTDIINLQNEVDDINQSVFDIETSMMIGSVVAVIVFMILTMIACWYVMIRKKKFSVQH